MEQVPPARRSSGIQEIATGSTQSLGSAASLRGHAAIPAGSRFAEGTGVAQTTTADAVPPASGTGTKEGPDQTPKPPTKPFYRRRWFIISSLILIPLGIALLFIILFPVVRAIIQLVIKRTQLEIDAAVISHPQNDTIEFPEPVEVSWFEDEFTETMIGTITFDTLFAKDKRAPINTTTNFTITDENAFGRFSTQLITSQNFTWRLKSSSLKVQALKFPVAKGLSFDKNVTMNGVDNNSSDVTLT
ncbi:hypothetical protein C0992_006160 [Termitomyces sp. T32_za158]|nr:hypothetical protein C0992_006160 [Termitomyces sp. T32_za158]